MTFAKSKSSHRISSLQNPSTSGLAQRPAACGLAPLVIGESKADYEQLFHGVWQDLQPVGVLEEIFVCEIVDLIWEIARFRREKASLMNATAHKGLQLLLAHFPFKHPMNLVEAWSAREPQAIKEVDEILKNSELTIDAVRALTLSDNLDQFERMERIGAMLEARRAALLRELNRHRMALQLTARQAIPSLEEIEHPVIDSPPGGRGGTA